MATNKPVKPDSELPVTWGGIQYPYTEEQVSEGLPEAVPTVIDGGTLNYEKKGVFERLDYVTQVADVVNNTPIKKTIISNANNQFDYAGIGIYSYSATQNYGLNDFVISVMNNETKIYKSLIADNIGKELTNETYWEELSLGGGSGLEIGDIGIAPLGIDESQNKRRYLNGQIISQEQFTSFTRKIKEAIALYPSLAATEENWQAEVTNSVNGTCGKFVIDDGAGTIRLPKYPNYVSKEYVEAAVVGNGMTLGLTNGSQNFGMYSTDNGPNNYLFRLDTYGQQLPTSAGNTTANTAKGIGVTTDPTKSGIIANLANAITETIPCKYFIQVATGVEESVDVTREIELNNPFSLLDYKWSEYELTNASWLLSNGAFHSGTVYKAVYELLLKIKNGAVTKDGVSVKLSTEAYEDTDFVINTADTTFRLPIKVKLASGNAVVGNGMTLGLTNNGVNNDTGLLYTSNLGFVVGSGGYGNPAGTSTSATAWTTTSTGVTTDPEKSGLVLADNDMYLYFYVGETIQDANVINASGVLTRVAELSDSYISGLVMPDYSAEITGLTMPYTAVADGYIKPYAAINQYMKFTIGNSENFVVNSYNWADQSLFPISKGETVTKTEGTFLGMTFIPCKGAK